jgi:hypothetical protein
MLRLVALALLPGLLCTAAPVCAQLSVEKPAEAPRNPGAKTTKFYAALHNKGNSPIAVQRVIKTCSCMDFYFTSPEQKTTTIPALGITTATLVYDGKGQGLIDEVEVTIFTDPHQDPPPAWKLRIENVPLIRTNPPTLKIDIPTSPSGNLETALTYISSDQANTPERTEVTVLPAGITAQVDPAGRKPEDPASFLTRYLLTIPPELLNESGLSGGKVIFRAWYKAIEKPVTFETAIVPVIAPR